MQAARWLVRGRPRRSSMCLPRWGGGRRPRCVESCVIRRRHQQIPPRARRALCSWPSRRVLPMHLRAHRHTLWTGLCSRHRRSKPRRARPPRRTCSRCRALRRCPHRQDRARRRFLRLDCPRLSRDRPSTRPRQDRPLPRLRRGHPLARRSPHLRRQAPRRPAKAGTPRGRHTP